MKRISAILASALLATAAASAQASGNPAAGKQKSQTCASCHGADGNSENTQYPRLAGQHQSYIYQALHEYKSGARQNPIMSGMVANLSDQDMQDLAAYFSRQQGLRTLPLSGGD